MKAGRDGMGAMMHVCELLLQDVGMVCLPRGANNDVMDVVRVQAMV